MTWKILKKRQMVSPTTRRREPDEQQVLMALLNGTHVHQNLGKDFDRPSLASLGQVGCSLRGPPSHCRRLHRLMQKLFSPADSQWNHCQLRAAEFRRDAAVLGEFGSVGSEKK